MYPHLPVSAYDGAGEVVIHVAQARLLLLVPEQPVTASPPSCSNEA